MTAKDADLITDEEIDQMASCLDTLKYEGPEPVGFGACGAGTNVCHGEFVDCITSHQTDSAERDAILAQAVKRIHQAWKDAEAAAFQVLKAEGERTDVKLAVVGERGPELAFVLHPEVLHVDDDHSHGGDGHGGGGRGGDQVRGAGDGLIPGGPL